MRFFIALLLFMISISKVYAYDEFKTTIIMSNDEKEEIGKLHIGKRPEKDCYMMHIELSYAPTIFEEDILRPKPTLYETQYNISIHEEKKTKSADLINLNAIISNIELNHNEDYFIYDSKNNKQIQLKVAFKNNIIQISIVSKNIILFKKTYSYCLAEESLTKISPETIVLPERTCTKFFSETIINISFIETIDKAKKYIISHNKEKRGSILIGKHKEKDCYMMRIAFDYISDKENKPAVSFSANFDKIQHNHSEDFCLNSIPDLLLRSEAINEKEKVRARLSFKNNIIHLKIYLKTDLIFEQNYTLENLPQKVCMKSFPKKSLMISLFSLDPQIQKKDIPENANGSFNISPIKKNNNNEEQF